MSGKRLSQGAGGIALDSRRNHTMYRSATTIAALAAVAIAALPPAADADEEDRRGVAALVPARLVEQAELKLGSAGLVFSEVELLPPPVNPGR